MAEQEKSQASRDSDSAQLRSRQEEQVAKIQQLESQIIKLNFEKNRTVTQKEKVFQTLFDDQE